MTDVMDELVGSSSEQYAVVEARWTNRRPERFVLAYHDEESLRKLIAAPSIIAVGFTSREEAVTDVESYFRATCPKHLAGSTVTDRPKYKCDAHSAKQPIDGLLIEAWKNARGLMQHAVALVILIFYSRNAVSATIRVFLGA